MRSLKLAIKHFSTAKMDEETFTIGHLSDETAKLIARDMFLIGCHEESEILSDNDTSRYTAIVNKENGQALEVFFDISVSPKAQISAST